MTTGLSKTTVDWAEQSSAGAEIKTVAGVPAGSALVYALLFVIAFGFYTTAWVNAPVTEPDTGSYLRAARDLADFRLDQLQERPPGYPLLILLTRSTVSPTRALFYVSLVFHFMSIWLLASILSRAGASQLASILFGVVLLLPPYVEPAGYALSENLAELMLVLAFVGVVFWILDRKTGWIVVAGLTTAYAALTRPAYQLLFVAIVAYLCAGGLLHWTRVKGRELLQASAILVSASIIVVGGYAFVNYTRFGHFVVTPKFGLTLSTKTFAFLERLPDEHAEIRSALIRARNAEVAAGVPRAGVESVWSAVPELTKITGLQGPELSDYMLRVNLQLIRRAPLNFLQEVAWAFGCYWFPSGNVLANFNSRTLQFTWAGIHFILMAGFGVVLVLVTGAGAALYVNACDEWGRLDAEIRNSRPSSLEVQALTYGLAGTIVFYTAVLSSLIEAGAPRYRMPTDALIVFMLVLGLDLWRRLVSSVGSGSRRHLGASTSTGGTRCVA